MQEITEDYVSFEIAKLLKEKGFEQYKCPHSYSSKGVFKWSDNLNPYEYTAPSQAMVMKWLRKKGIYITITYGDYPSLNKVFWTPQIDSLEGFDLPIDFYKEYDEYEEAEEAAIKYALENLI